ncbi:MAG: Rrf2 family transcriptional regulator [Gemmatimonadota bacterium]
MQLTRESEHAIRGLAFLAGEPPDQPITVSAIANARDLPPSFLAKIFQKLARHGLVQSARGRGNGYSLARKPTDISVLEVAVAVEGSVLLTRCLLWSAHCHDDDPCPLHYLLKDRARLLEDRLGKITISDVAAAAPES